MEGRKSAELLADRGLGGALVGRIGAKAWPRLARLGHREPKGRLERELGDALEDQRLDHVIVDATIGLVADVADAVTRRREDLAHALVSLEIHAALRSLARMTRENLLHAIIASHSLVIDAAVELDLLGSGRDRESSLEDVAIGIGTSRHRIPGDGELLQRREIDGPDTIRAQNPGIGVRDHEHAGRRMCLGHDIADLVRLGASSDAPLDLLVVVGSRHVALEDERLHIAR